MNIEKLKSLAKSYLEDVQLDLYVHLSDCIQEIDSYNMHKNNKPSDEEKINLINDMFKFYFQYKYSATMNFLDIVVIKLFDMIVQYANMQDNGAPVPECDEIENDIIVLCLQILTDTSEDDIRKIMECSTQNTGVIIYGL